MRRAAALLFAGLAASCSGADAPAEVRVFAASSLTEVMQTIAADFEQVTGTRVKLNLASSSVLAKQIVEGAPCDVFLSADQEWADFVEKADLVVPGTRRDLLTNALVVVTPRSSQYRGPGSEPPDPARLWEAPLLDSRNRVALGDPGHVPAGRYAKATLQSLRFWERIESRVVPCESVRAALALVERGEVAAGIVYATDAKASKADLATVPLPQVPGVDIRYPAMRVHPWRGAGYQFNLYLGSPAAGRVFEAAGFGFTRRAE